MSDAALVALAENLNRLIDKPGGVYSSNDVAARQVRAQLRLITTSNFVAFLDLERQEQLEALLAVQASSDTLVEILEQIHPT